MGFTIFLVYLSIFKNPPDGSACPRVISCKTLKITQHENSWQIKSPKNSKTYIDIEQCLPRWSPVVVSYASVGGSSDYAVSSLPPPEQMILQFLSVGKKVAPRLNNIQMKISASFTPYTHFPLVRVQYLIKRYSEIDSGTYISSCKAKNVQAVISPSCYFDVLSL